MVLGWGGGGTESTLMEIKHKISVHYFEWRVVTHLETRGLPTTFASYCSYPQVHVFFTYLNLLCHLYSLTIVKLGRDFYMILYKLFKHRSRLITISLGEFYGHSLVQRSQNFNGMWLAF